IDDCLASVAPGLRERLRAELQRLADEFDAAPGLRTSALFLTSSDSPGSSTRTFTDALRERAPAAKIRGGRFEVHERLGAGGGGSVWRAFDRSLGRWVALKAPHAASQFDAERFVREGRTLARLQHPRIVRVLDAGRDELGCYLISELIEGCSLADKLKQTTFSPRDAASILSAIADGLAYAHRSGIVHRDLKPHNILIDAAGQPYITDFGLAKEWWRQTDALTQPGHVLGTPAFMAPEQTTGEVGREDPRTDIYSLGVILFQLLTGELPFRGNVESILQQVVSSEPPSPRTLAPAVPLELEVLCLKCLEKSPSQRLASADLLRDELQRFLAHKPILSRPLGPWGRLRKAARRHPAAAWLGGLVVALGVVVVAVSLTAAIVVGRGWNREFRLRVDAEIARQSADQARENEVDARVKAVAAQSAAEQSAKRATEEALLSQQSLQFMESALQAADPVGWVLGSDRPVKEGPPNLSELLDRAAVRIKSELASQPRVQTRLMDTIANSNRGLGRYVDAVQLLEQSRLIRAAAGLNDDPAVRIEAARNTFFRGLIHQDLAEFDAAERLFRELLGDQQRLADADPLFVADVEFQLGWVLNVRRQRDEAREHFERALAIRREHCPPGAAALKAAEVGLEFTQSDGGELSLEQLRTLVPGEDRVSRLFADYLTMLAFRRLKNYDAACARYEQIIKQLESQLTDQHPLFLLALGEYAGLLSTKGDYRAALPRIEKAIATAEKIAPDHEKLKKARELFGYELMRAQRFAEADVHFQKVVDQDARDGKFSVHAHDGLVWTSLMAGRNAKGRDVAQALVERCRQESPYKLAWALYALARAADRVGDAAASAAADEESLRVAKSLETLPEQPLWLEHLSSIFARVGEYQRSEELLRKAVALERERHPAEHPQLADRLHTLAVILQRQQRSEEAAECFRESLTIRERTLPENDARIEQTRQVLAALSGVAPAK
ncbi:MAG TPA: serine/threonine-protein kinase, partial [Pirellulaceae bacterium]|nr:serine/threonine-protein kinase [Pirellulaceae bacterium]